MTSKPSILATAADQEALRCAGAGSLSDLAKMAYAEGGTLTLTPEEATCSGPGFVQDLMRMDLREGGGTPAPVAPTLTSITPSSVAAGSADMVVSLIGSGFTAATLLNFGGQTQNTTFSNSTEVFALIHPAAVAGTIQVFVTEAGLSSAPLPFT